MGDIEVKIFRNCNDFINNIKSGTKTLNVSIKDMVRYAISAGGFSYWSVGAKGITFYTALVEMALTDGKNFKIGEDYKKSEQSIRTSISFFMGMIAAQAVADKEYKIAYLFHLKDPQIIFSSTGKTPDFFGLNNIGTPILLEAKGTTSKKPTNKVVKVAKNQIKSINCIEIDGWKAVYRKKQIKGHVISSCFDNDILTYYDVDPEANGETKLNICIDKAIVFYYRNIMHLLLTNNNQNNTYNNTTYIMTKVGSYQIGLNKRVFDILKEYEEIYSDLNKNIDLSNFNFEGKYLQISDTAKEIQHTDMDISIGLDGILCK